MIYRTERSKIDEYFKDEAFSQSALKALQEGYHIYLKYKEEPEKKRYYDESPEHMLRGSMVDCIITEGMDVYNQQYFVGTMATKPSPTIMSIIHKTLALIKETRTSTDADNPEPEIPFGILDQENYHPFIVQSAREHGYQANYRDPALITAVVREGAEYWNELLTANGRTVVSLEEHNNAIAIASNIKLNYLVRKEIFGGYDREELADGDLDFYYQFPIYARLDGVSVKGLLDLVVVNHRRREIFVVDFKVIYDTTKNFHYLMRKRKLDFQVSFYTHILKAMLFNLMPNVANYTVKMPKFVVASSKYNEDIDVFTLSQNLYDVVIGGVPFYYTTGMAAEQFINIPHAEVLGLIKILQRAKYMNQGENPTIVNYGTTFTKVLDLHGVIDINLVYEGIDAGDNNI